MWIEEIEKCVAHVRNDFEVLDDSELDHFLKGCLVFKKVARFINIASIEDKEECKNNWKNSMTTSKDLQAWKPELS